MQMKTGIKTSISGDMSWSDEAKTELFDHNEHHYIWRKKGETCKSVNTIPGTRVEGSYCGHGLLQEELVNFIKEMAS